MSWQREYLSELFGWKRKDGTRKCKRTFLFIPRKNGKSTLGAGIALYLLLADEEAGAQVYSAAADRQQASIVFDEATKMIELSPRLKSLATIKRNVIGVTKNGSRYQALSADAFTKHGLNAHGVIFDELHAQKNRDLWDVLTQSVVARRQPMIVAITTAGSNKFGICGDLYYYSKKIISGSVKDDTFLPWLYEPDATDDPHDEAT